MSGLLALALLAAAPGADEVEVAVLVHPVARGERVEASDFSVEARTGTVARGALTADAAGGMEAARNLSAGTVVRASDLVRPRLVRRGEPVTIRIISGPLVITASGRALGDASAGGSVRVVANETSRTLDGVVESAGTVRIMTP